MAGAALGAVGATFASQVHFDCLRSVGARFSAKGLWPELPGRRNIASGAPAPLGLSGKYGRARALLGSAPIAFQAKLCAS